MSTIDLSTEMTRKGRHIIVYRGGGDQPFRWKELGGNGEVISSAEGFLTEANAVRAADNSHPDLRIWIMDDGSKVHPLRPEGEVMAGPGPLPIEAE